MKFETLAHLCSADKRSGESEPILEEGRNGGKKQDRKKKSFSQSTTSLSEGLVDLPRVQSKESEPSKKKQKEVKRQELEIAKESLIASGASARGRGQVLADSSLMAKMSKKLSGSKFRLVLLPPCFASEVKLSRTFML